MVDREKVIKGLSECITVLNAHVPERYIGYSAEACLGAIELLKEQEPHVLTLEEAEKAEYCVLEVRNGSLLQVVHDEAGGYFSPSLNNLQKLYYERLFNEDEHDDYNKRIRCWSALPSKEQRQAVKWDGEA